MVNEEDLSSHFSPLFDREATLMDLQRQEYQNAAAKYRLLLSKQSESLLLPEISDQPNFEEKIPEEWFQQINNFVNKLLAQVPKSCFEISENIPINRLKIKALIGAAYNKLSETEKSPEYMIRLLSVLSIKTLVVSLENNTNAILEKYFLSRQTREDLQALLIELLKETMPVHAYDEGILQEKLSRYQEFCRVLFPKVNEARQLLQSEIKRICFLKKENLIFFDPIYTSDFKRVKVQTNDFQLSDANVYNSVTAGAVASGIDLFTGLPLILREMPIEVFVDEETEWHQDKNLLLFKEISFFLHENVHNVAEDEGEESDDFSAIINELLTDSAAHILGDRIENIPFSNPPDSFTKIGYKNLVSWARSLVEEEIFSEDDLLYFAFNQDPQSFLDSLSKKIRSDETVAKKVFFQLNAGFLIFPSKTNKFAQRIQELHENPELFLKEKMLEAWKELGSEWISPYFLRPIIADMLEVKFPEKGRNFYREKIFSPQHGGLDDEAVDAFWRYVSHSKQSKPSTLFLDDQSAKKLLESSSGIEENFSSEFIIDANYMKALHLLSQNKNFESAFLLHCAEILNKTLNQIYDIPMNERIILTQNFSQELFQKVSSSLVPIFKELSPEKIADELNDFFTAIVPCWFLYGGSHFQNFASVIDTINGTVQALVENPHGNSNQREFFKYWSKSIVFDNGLDDAEANFDGA